MYAPPRRCWPKRAAGSVLDWSAEVLETQDPNYWYLSESPSSSSSGGSSRSNSLYTIREKEEANLFASKFYK